MYDVYYFDLQNPDGVLAGEKPVVVELGPYSYDEYYVKFDISWSDGGNIVSYNTQRFYLFNPARTNPGLSDTDLITLPYPSVIGFEFLLKEIPEAASLLLEELIIGAIQEKENAVDLILDEIYADVIANPNVDGTRILAELAFINRSVASYFDVRI